MILPNRIEAIAIKPKIMRNVSLSAAGASRNKRITTANIPILLAVAKNAPVGAGAPWYTSGVHNWNGNKESLKPIPTNIMPNPASTNGL